MLQGHTCQLAMAYPDGSLPIQGNQQVLIQQLQLSPGDA